MNRQAATRLGALSLLVGLLAGCSTPGSSLNIPPDTSAAATASAQPSAEAEAVFRDFITAINAGDAERAASLVATDARFNQTGGSPIGHVRSLPCEAEIVSAEGTEDSVRVELRFTGTNEWGADCIVMAPGESDPFVIAVEDGKIVNLRHEEDPP